MGTIYNEFEITPKFKHQWSIASYVQIKATYISEDIRVIIKNELADMETSSTIYHLELMCINMLHIYDSEKS